MPDNLYIDTSILTTEPAEVYHAKAKVFLSSHQLADFIRCPQLYRKKQLGLAAVSDTPAFHLGRAAHVRILEGRDVYADTYAFGGPINPKTGRPYGATTKAFAEWSAAQGKPVVTPEQEDLIEQMATGVGANSVAVELITAGVAEGVVRTEYGGMACQIRMDWLNPYRGMVDLKTCDDLTWFEADAKRYGYHRQMAFYRAVLARALMCPNHRVPVHIIAVEKREPYRCGVWCISDETLTLAQSENEAAIRRLMNCQQRDIWPTGYEEIRILHVC